MEQGQIEKLLLELPRSSASQHFTQRVLARLTDGPPNGVSNGIEVAEQRTSSIWRPILVPALALGLALVVLGGLVLIRDPQQQNRERMQEIERAAVRRQQVESLQREYRALEEEFRDIQLLAAQSQPIIGFAGDDDIDYLIDLRDIELRDLQSREAGRYLALEPGETTGARRVSYP